jgi:hypothetical protein
MLESLHVAALNARDPRANDQRETLGPEMARREAGEIHRRMMPVT